jgi:NAD-dependent DNA ligase
MIVQYPRKDDPQVTDRQFDRISEALAALEEQADQEEIRFRPLNTVDEIGDHLLEKEAA